MMIDSKDYNLDDMPRSKTLELNFYLKIKPQEITAYQF
jgi:hypothetical protein